MASAAADIGIDRSTSARAFVDGLVSSLSEIRADETFNPLAVSQPAVKHMLLTLHALFPNELFPALDLLDRRLVLKLSTSNEAAAREERSYHQDDTTDHNRSNDLTGHAQAQSLQSHSKDPAKPDHPFPGTKDNIADTSAPSSVLTYYVRSTQQRQQSRPGWRDIAEQTIHYEVRLNAWNCSCPAFTFAVLSGNGSSVQSKIRQARQCSFGGLSQGDDLPVCKHLLACFLADRCPVFNSLTQTKIVSENEMAAWAAGWVD